MLTKAEFKIFRKLTGKIQWLAENVMPDLAFSALTLSTKNNPDMLAVLYKSIIRPIFEYGSICMISAADCHIEKLQLLQNQALRSVLKTPSYVAIKDLHDLSGVPMIKDHLLSFARNQLTNMSKHSPLIQSAIDEYEKVKRIKENASILDILST